MFSACSLPSEIIIDIIGNIYGSIFIFTVFGFLNFLQETENAIAALGKSKVSLSFQLEDTKRLADAKARDRASLFKRVS